MCRIVNSDLEQEAYDESHQYVLVSGQWAMVEFAVPASEPSRQQKIAMLREDLVQRFKSDLLDNWMESRPPTIYGGE